MTERNRLAGFLRATRERRGLTLRAVEEATGISNPYLSQLEHGRIRQPSPVILHKLSELYEVSYTEAMRLAGYPVPRTTHAGQADQPARPLSRFGDVSPEEEQELIRYLEFIRTRRGGESR